jgi:hypothetical protein
VAGGIDRGGDGHVKQLAMVRLRRQGEEALAEMDATEEQQKAAVAAVHKAWLEQKNANGSALPMLLRGCIAIAVPTCWGVFVVGSVSVVPIAAIAARSERLPFCVPAPCGSSISTLAVDSRN